MLFSWKLQFFLMGQNCLPFKQPTLFLFPGGILPNCSVLELSSTCWNALAHCRRILEWSSKIETHQIIEQQLELSNFVLHLLLCHSRDYSIMAARDEVIPFTRAHQQQLEDELNASRTLHEQMREQVISQRTFLQQQSTMPLV